MTDPKPFLVDSKAVCNHRQSMVTKIVSKMVIKLNISLRLTKKLIREVLVNFTKHLLNQKRPTAIDSNLILKLV